MNNDLLNLINLDPDEDAKERLRLALMFKTEVDEATRYYTEMLQLSIEHLAHNQEEANGLVEQTINAALLTGIRAYRSWIESQGINVEVVEQNSGKDIPPDFFHANAKWPL